MCTHVPLYTRPNSPVTACIAHKVSKEQWISKMWFLTCNNFDYVFKSYRDCQYHKFMDTVNSGSYIYDQQVTLRKS